MVNQIIMKKLILTEQQITEIIKEEYGISNDVIKKTKEVYQILLSAIREKNINKEQYEYYTISKHNITFNIMSCKINCSLTVYNFYNRDYYIYSNVKSDGWSAYLSQTHGIMGCIVPCISGKPIKEIVMNTIQHELEHLYQEILMEKTFSDGTTYAKLKDNLKSKNEIEYNAARLVYGCIKSEQEGYVNGLYAYLMSLPNLFSMDSLYKSDCWKLYSEMVNILNEFKDNIFFVDELKKYKLTIVKIKRAVYMFLKKIGKVIVKVKQDKYKKQNFRD